MRQYNFNVVLEVGGAGSNVDLARVEEFLSLHIQDLLYDEQFTVALDAEESISSTVTILDK
jgi:hypothetical protein